MVSAFLLGSELSSLSCLRGADQTREYLDNKYEELLLMIGNYHKEKGDIKKAEKAFRRIIVSNPLSFIANNQLLDLYSDFKKLDMFKEHFIQYSKILKNEFQEVPENRHLLLYKMLI